MEKQTFDSGFDKSGPIIRFNRAGKVALSLVPLQSQVPGKRILCVDDEILGTKLRGEILERRGYSVTLCHYPLEALRCDLSLFDLAILDFEMPQLNGRDLFLRMRASGARFPILLFSASADILCHEDRVLFARCVDKARPVQCLLNVISEFLSPNQVPDFGT